MQSSMRKLLGKPTPASSNSSSPAHRHGDGAGKDDGDSKGQRGSGRPSTSPVPLLYHPAAPQEVSYDANAPIAALDKSPDGQSSILAGRHVLKAVRVDGVSVREEFDLRALITAAQAAPRANTTVSAGEQLSIRDVKWGRGRNDAHIFTACLRGKIFQYDLSRLGARTSSTAVGGGMGGGGGENVDLIQTQEDTRQINTLDINPSHDVFLLSGSQDGFVRLFDTRKLVADPRLGPTFKHMQGFKCNADVRDVQWSPREGFLFACCTEQGMVLKWDIRKGNAPLQRIAAHEKACASISWHPDGEHLISGGIDRACHVWDMTKTADKRQNPKYTLYTSGSVAAVAWRPGQWSASLEGIRATQVAVSYDVSGPQRAGVNAVHIWDLARPTIPYKTIERPTCSPSALLWKDADFLWSGGEDGIFCQSDLTFAPRAIDRTAMSTLSFSSCGDVLAFLDERPPQPKAKKLTAASAASADRPPPHSTLVVSRSDSEDDAVRTFIMPRRRGASARPRRASSVPNTSTTSTPPSSAQSRDAHASPSTHSNSGHATGRHGQIQSSSGGGNSTGSSGLTVSLDKALRATGTFRPQQIMAIGHVPSAARQDTYGYLSRIYLETLEHGLPPVRRDGVVISLPERVAEIMEQYARAAELVSQFRLAQVWRIVSFATDLLFRRRGLYHKQKRIEEGKKTPAAKSAAVQHTSSQKSGTPVGKPISDAVTEDRSETGTVRTKSALDSLSTSSSKNGAAATSSSSGRTLPVRSLLTEEIESTSNMPTPLARPVSGMAYLGEQFQRGAYAGYEFQASTNSGNAGGGSGSGAPSDIESLNLPPAQYKDYLSSQPRRRHLNSMPLSEVSHASHSSGKSHMSSVEGYDFYDTEAMAHAIDVPGAPRDALAPPPVSFTSAASDAASSPASKLSVSPIRAHDFHRQDSTDSAVFAISQATNSSTPDDEHGHGGARGRQAKQQADQDEDAADKPGAQAPLASSVGSSRLLRLNKALISMEWSGSDLTMSTTAPRDTYYRNASQDTASSNNSFTKRRPSASKPPPARPGLQRSGSSRLDAMSIATSELLPTDDDDDKDDDKDKDDNKDADAQDRMTDRDYLPWPHDPPYPYPVEGLPTSGLEHNAALDPYTIIGRALAHEVRTSPLHASAMVLLLKPLVPDDVIDPLQAKAILRQHHARLMGMQLFIEAALLRKLCVPGWPARRMHLSSADTGAPDDAPSGIELSKWGAAGTLEMGGVAAYTTITSPAQKNVVASYLCVTCQKPREIEKNPLMQQAGGSGADESVWKCGRCRSVMAPCAVCGHRIVSALAPLDGEAADDANASVLSTWWYCVGCAHGGHLTCLEGWHASAGSASASSAPGAGSELSDGCCPLDGCGHACLPGQWRAETNAQRSDDLSRTLLSSSSLLSASGRDGAGGHDIRPDGNDVGPSRAVDMVRENLGVLGTSPGRGGMLGGFGGEAREPRERRKSVKFAGTNG